VRANPVREAELVALRALCGRKELSPPVGATKPRLPMRPSRLRNSSHAFLLCGALFSLGTLKNQGDRSIVYKPNFHMGAKNPGFHGDPFG
jgi:hypothetical protein